MKHKSHAASIRIAACLAMALGAATSMPVAAGPFDSSDALVQKARPMAFGDFAARKQLCARLSVDGSCMDDLPSIKDDLLAPELGDPPPLPDTLPVRDPIIEAPAMVPQPMVIAVPEPSSTATLLAVALAVALLSRSRRQTRRA